VKELVAEFKKRMSTEVRRQEKLNMVEKKDFRREELPKKYTVKILNNGKFKNKYLKKLEKIGISGREKIR